MHRSRNAALRSNVLRHANSFVSSVAGCAFAQGRECVVRCPRIRSRRRRGKTHRPSLSVGRAHGHAEIQTEAHRRLRRRRLSLRDQQQARRLVAAGAFRSQRSAASCGICVEYSGKRTRRRDAYAGKIGGEAGVHGTRAGRAEPLEHRAQRRMATAQDEARRRSSVPSVQRRAVSPWHKASALASG